MPKSKTATCIRLAMAKKGITGKTLAKEMMVTETTVSRWRDTGCENISTLENIARWCDMSFEELMEMGD